ncbi:hypothetical protein GGGNBK_19620 [Sporosarcina sp. ANT_H38]
MCTITYYHAQVLEINMPTAYEIETFRFYVREKNSPDYVTSIGIP